MGVGISSLIAKGAGAGWGVGSGTARGTAIAAGAARGVDLGCGVVNAAGAEVESDIKFRSASSTAVWRGPDGMELEVGLGVETDVRGEAGLAIKFWSASSTTACGSGVGVAFAAATTTGFPVTLGNREAGSSSSRIFLPSAFSMRIIDRLSWGGQSHSDSEVHSWSWR